MHCLPLPETWMYQKLVLVNLLSILVGSNQQDMVERRRSRKTVQVVDSKQVECPPKSMKSRSQVDDVRYYYGLRLRKTVTIDSTFSQSPELGVSARQCPPPAPGTRSLQLLKWPADLAVRRPAYGASWGSLTVALKRRGRLKLPGGRQPKAAIGARPAAAPTAAVYLRPGRPPRLRRGCSSAWLANIDTIDAVLSDVLADQHSPSCPWFQSCLGGAASSSDPDSQAAANQLVWGLILIGADESRTLDMKRDQIRMVH